MGTPLPMAIIADDIELNRALLSQVLMKHYRVLEAADGQQVLDLLEQNLEQVAVVLLDIVMPVMDGFEVLSAMNRKGWLKRVPVIIISAEDSEDFVLRGYELGACDFIGRPLSPNIALRRVDNIVELNSHKVHLEKLVLQQMNKLKQTNNFMIDTLSTVVEFRNGESGLHVRRIRAITETLLRAIAYRHKEYGLTATKIEEIANAAALHDIGKIAVPENILNKPGKLTPQEFEVMKQHTVKGAEILKGLEHIQDQTYYRYCYNICRYHHERWDGRGYPDGLVGGQIPLCAQVVSVADVYDALTSQRVYKPPYAHEDAIRMIREGECGQFNPQILTCLTDIDAELRAGTAFSFMTATSLDTAQLRTDGLIPALPDNTLILLERERERSRSLLALSSELLFDYDYDSDTSVFSNRFLDTFGGTPVRRNMSKLMEEPSMAGFLELCKLLSAQRPVQSANLLCKTADGSKHWFEVSICSQWSAGPSPRYLGCIGKFTPLTASSPEPTPPPAPQRDPLTGLAGREATKRQVEDLLSAGDHAAGALMFIDIDGFQRVNDRQGSSFGDAVLKFVAQKMRAIFRTTDVVGRVGGDEFVVFLNEVHSREHLVKKAEEVCALFHSGYPEQPVLFPLSGSVGIALLPQDASSYDELLQRAAQALKRSKLKGHGNYSFFQRGVDALSETPSLPGAPPPRL